MKRFMLVVCAAAVLLLPLSAVAQSHHRAASPKATITVPATLVVGTAVIASGDYRFQCLEIDGKTYLVITSIDTGKEITRVPCVREALDAKVVQSELRSVVSTSGVRELKSVRIKGDTVAHRLVD